MMDSATCGSVVLNRISLNGPIGQSSRCSTWRIRSVTIPRDSPNAIAAIRQLITPYPISANHAHIASYIIRHYPARSQGTYHSSANHILFHSPSPPTGLSRLNHPHPHQLPCTLIRPRSSSRKVFTSHSSPYNPSMMLVHVVRG